MLHKSRSIPQQPKIKSMQSIECKLPEQLTQSYSSDHKSNVQEGSFRYLHVRRVNLLVTSLEAELQHPGQDARHTYDFPRAHNTYAYVAES